MPTQESNSTQTTNSSDTMPAPKPQPLKDTKVFQPLKVGSNTLGHRVVYAPTSRERALDDNTPSDLQYKYYDKRLRFPGTLVITEATFASERLGMYAKVPGIYTDKQTEAWKKIVSKIHANKSFASVQLWALGRTADSALLKERGHSFHSASAIYFDEASKKAALEAGNPIVALTEDEIKDIILTDYTIAAQNAMKAGFDYVEVHAAHGYLFDQFLLPVSNHRTDKYGGSVENRARFLLEVIDHLSELIGADKVAVRISPWARVLGIKAHKDTIHPITTFSYVLHELQQRADRGNALAYVSIVEPRVQGNTDVEASQQHGDNAFAKLVWHGVVLQSGNYSYDAPEFNTLVKDLDDGRTLVGFSRFFTSNPDLVKRLKEGQELTPYERDTFYLHNNWGYNTWPEHGEERTADERTELKVLPMPIESVSN